MLKYLCHEGVCSQCRFQSHGTGNESMTQEHCLQRRTNGVTHPVLLTATNNTIEAIYMYKE